MDNKEEITKDVKIRGGKRQGAGRKQKFVNPVVMGFKVEADLKDSATSLYGKELPELFTKWLKGMINKKSKTF